MLAPDSVMVPRNISFDPEVVTPANAAIDAILSDDESKAIRLWQREPMPFTAKSVTHEDFRQLHIVPPPPAQRQSYSPNPHRLDSRTTTGESYKAIPIPMGVEALGVRTQNDGFHALIASGSYPPCKGAAVFTTTHDHQETVSIKVLALIGNTAGGATRVPLGSFELAGVPSALAGVPQLLVTFELDADMVLRVTAEDRTRAHHGAHVRASITIHDRLPTPERERPSTLYM